MTFTQQRKKLFFKALLVFGGLVQAPQIVHAAEKKQENEKLQAVQRPAHKKQKVVMMAPEQELLLPAVFPMELHQLIRDYLFNYREDFFPILYQSIPLVGHAQHIRVVTMTPDCSTIVTGGGGNEKLAKVWDVAGKCIKSLDNHTGFINAVAVTPDGKFVVTGSWVGDARVWDRVSDQSTQLRGHTDDITSVAITSDGNTVITGSADKTVKIWDRKTAQCLCTLSGYEMKADHIVISKDGSTFGARSPGYPGIISAVKVYDIAGNARGTLTHQNEKYVHYPMDIHGVGLAPDGNIIVTGAVDKSVKVWEMTTGRCIKTLGEHPGWVLYAVLDPRNAHYCITVSRSYAVSCYCLELRNWDLISGQCIEKWNIPFGCMHYFVDENAFAVTDRKGETSVKKFNEAISKELPALSYAQLVCLKQLLDSLNQSQDPTRGAMNNIHFPIVVSKQQGVALFALPVEYQRNICAHYDIRETVQEFYRRMDQDYKNTEESKEKKINR